MKSPFDGIEMKLVYEKRKWMFRGEEYDYVHAAWLDVERGEQFTTDETDDAGFTQVTNQYREKYGIPYTDEIISIRKKYGLNAAKMSLILGIGINQYRQYEQGDVPSVSNGRIIRSAAIPDVMIDLVNGSKNLLSQNEYEKISAKVKAEAANADEYKLSTFEKDLVFPNARGMINGYAPTSLSRLNNALLFIICECGKAFFTKMNKLLFYIDFVAYRNLGSAVTGLSYRALEYGPVPERWDRVYSLFDNVKPKTIAVGDFEGIELISDVPPETSLFTSQELSIMEMVCNRFKDCSSREISRLSHDESAWLNHSKQKEHIPFTDAFSLKSV